MSCVLSARYTRCLHSCVAAPGDLPSDVARKATWLVLLVLGVISGTSLTFQAAREGDSIKQYAGGLQLVVSVVLGLSVVIRKQFSAGLEATAIVLTTIIIAMFDLAVGVRRYRGWPYFLVVLDTMVLTNVPTSWIRVFFGFMAIYLCVIGIEFGWRIGIYDAPFFASYEERVPQCMEPPCPDGAVDLFNGFVFPMLVFLYAYRTITLFKGIAEAEAQKNEQAVAVCNKVAARLASFDLDAAQQELAAGRLPGELELPLATLLLNLRSYEPYLPQSLMRGGDSDPDDEAEEIMSLPSSNSAGCVQPMAPPSPVQGLGGTPSPPGAASTEFTNASPPLLRTISSPSLLSAPSWRSRHKLSGTTPIYAAAPGVSPTRNVSVVFAVDGIPGNSNIAVPAAAAANPSRRSSSSLKLADGLSDPHSSNPSQSMPSPDSTTQGATMTYGAQHCAPSQRRRSFMSALSRRSEGAASPGVAPTGTAHDGSLHDTGSAGFVSLSPPGGVVEKDNVRTSWPNLSPGPRPLSDSEMRRSSFVLRRYLKREGVTLLTASLPVDAAVDILPDAWVRLHSEHLATILATTKVTRGVLDRFVGERVWISFNAFKRAVNHSTAALNMALAVREKLPDAKCGILTGHAMVGQLGTDIALSTCIVGDLCTMLNQVLRAGALLDCPCVCNRLAYRNNPMTIGMRIMVHQVYVATDEMVDADDDTLVLYEVLSSDRSKEGVASHDAEWMYALQREPGLLYEDYNDAGWAMHQRGGSAALEVLGRPGVSECIRQEFLAACESARVLDLRPRSMGAPVRGDARSAVSSGGTSSPTRSERQARETKV